MTPHSPKSPLLQAVLDLAREGCSIIPVRQDKRPLIAWRRFQTERAIDELLREWFGSAKAHGAAIVTGAISGCVVLDIDGDDGFEALRVRQFDLPATLTVSTPRGGKHFYFEAPGLPTKNFTGGLKTCPLSKVDFRGESGYAICPPTPGYKYLNNLPLAPLPKWLKVLVIPGWNLLNEAINSATEGNRNDIGFLLACKLRDGGLLPGEAKPLLQAYARTFIQKGTSLYPESEALASLESAYSKPARSPRPDGVRSARQGQASRVLNLCEGLVLFHAPDQTAYAVIPVSSHSETWPIRSKTFKQFLARQSFERTGKVPNATALGDAMTVLEGQALFAGPEREVFLRIANRQGSIVLDLCNSRWEVIVTDATGWRIEKDSPVKFRRTRGLLPLPTPEPGGSLDELRSFLNLASEEDWRLLVVWILYSLRAHGPFPVLTLHGEQGSGKSSAVCFIRAVIDPNVSPVRSESREPRDLLISATNSYLLAFDNLSGLAPWLSDALCRLSTGGGFSTRELYTDQDEIILDAQRPIILNGIDAVVTRSDLLDRALMLTLPVMDEKQVRTEAALLQAFEEARPRLFGALLTGLSRSLQYLPHVHLDRLPRMADFALFGTAVERALGWPSDSFFEAYKNNRSQAHVIALDGSPIVEPLENLLENRDAWQGTASDLLRELEGVAPHAITQKRTWPQTPRSLGSLLSRLAPNLRAIGIVVEKERSGHERTRTLTLKREKWRNSSSALSACPPAQEINKLRADDDPDAVVRPVVRKNSKVFSDKARTARRQQACPQETTLLERVCSPADDVDNENPSSNRQKVHPCLAELPKMWRGVKPKFENNDVNNGVGKPKKTMKEEVNT